MAVEQDLTELIDRLPTQGDDEIAIQAIQGRALSKSKTSLHLAISTGLIAVPLDSIMKVIPVPGTKEIVRLVVRNPAGIRPLLRVVPTSTSRLATGGGPAVRRGEFVGSGWEGTNTCNYYDTPSVTGEEGDDASDDVDSDCQNDSEGGTLL